MVFFGQSVLSRSLNTYIHTYKLSAQSLEKTAAAVKEGTTPTRFNFYFVSPKGQEKVRSKKRRGGFDETFHHMVCFISLPLFVQQGYVPSPVDKNQLSDKGFERKVNHREISPGCIRRITDVNCQGKCDDNEQIPDAHT